MIYSIEVDFPEVVKISTIGYSTQNLPIQLVTLDAREYVVRK